MGSWYKENKIILKCKRKGTVIMKKLNWAKIMKVCAATAVCTGAFTLSAFAGNWVKNGTVWEYHENGVKVVNRWVQDNGKWYYFGKSGAMAHNQCVDGYYISSDGVWRKNETEKAVKKSGRIIQSDREVARDFGYATDDSDFDDTEFDGDWE